MQKRLRMNLQLPMLRQVLGLGLLIALLELFDSTTGQILGRAIDRGTAGRSGGLRYSEQSRHQPRGRSS